MKKNLKVINKLFNNYLNIDDISSSKSKDKSNSTIQQQIFPNVIISIVNNESNKNNFSNEQYNNLYQEEQKTFISTNVYTKSKKEKSESN